MFLMNAVDAHVEEHNPEFSVFRGERSVIGHSPSPMLFVYRLCELNRCEFSDFQVVEDATYASRFL